jgi:hypothetical protein
VYSHLALGPPIIVSKGLFFFTWAAGSCWGGALAHNYGRRAPCAREGERRERAPWRGGGAWPWQQQGGARGINRRCRLRLLVGMGGCCRALITSTSYGRWQSDFGRTFLAFSFWNRILVTVQNIFLDLHSTIFVQNLRWFGHWLESYRPTKIGLSVG